MSSSDESPMCPLCAEEMDATDRRFQPCQCGYQKICLWCWHQIHEVANASTLEALCPNCRRPYDKDTIPKVADAAAMAMAAASAGKKKRRDRDRDNRDRERARQGTSAGAHGAAHAGTGAHGPAVGPPVGNGHGGGGPGHGGYGPRANGAHHNGGHGGSMNARERESVASRRHLASVRVIQRNLVYVIGLPLPITREETLRRHEYFGQFGRIVKVATNRANTFNTGTGPTASAYVTYAHNDDAQQCIDCVDGCVMEGRVLRACFGTTKYCNAWLKNVPCNNPDCLYLHEKGTASDSFTKDEMVNRGHTRGSATAAAGDFHAATHTRAELDEDGIPKVMVLHGAQPPPAGWRAGGHPNVPAGHPPPAQFAQHFARGGGGGGGGRPGGVVGATQRTPPQQQGVHSGPPRGYGGMPIANGGPQQQQQQQQHAAQRGGRGMLSANMQPPPMQQVRHAVQMQHDARRPDQRAQEAFSAAFPALGTERKGAPRGGGELGARGQAQPHMAQQLGGRSPHVLPYPQQQQQQQQPAREERAPLANGHAVASQLHGHPPAGGAYSGALPPGMARGLAPLVAGQPPAGAPPPLHAHVEEQWPSLGAQQQQQPRRQSEAEAATQATHAQHVPRSQAPQTLPQGHPLAGSGGGAMALTSTAPGAMPSIGGQAFGGYGGGAAGPPAANGAVPAPDMAGRSRFAFAHLETSYVLGGAPGAAPLTTPSAPYGGVAPAMGAAPYGGAAPAMGAAPYGGAAPAMGAAPPSGFGAQQGDPRPPLQVHGHGHGIPPPGYAPRPPLQQQQQQQQHFSGPPMAPPPSIPGSASTAFDFNAFAQMMNGHGPGDPMGRTELGGAGSVFSLGGGGGGAHSLVGGQLGSVLGSAPMAPQQQQHAVMQPAVEMARAVPQGLAEGGVPNVNGGGGGGGGGGGSSRSARRREKKKRANRGGGVGGGGGDAAAAMQALALK